MRKPITVSRHRLVPSIGAVLSLTALAGLACSAIGARPFFAPLPDALLDTLRTDPASVITALTDLVVGEGLTVRVASPAEGYLETEWYDVVERRSTAGTGLDPRREIRLRFFADLAEEGHTQVAAEAVMRKLVDPSLASRENEMMAPPGHEGDQLVRRIFAALEIEIGSTKP
ncbi:MAG: hypothetical protein IH616_23125 [Gemmatimonadales bacterium]|nr:hypothetical protein [Gemmatimonadales bacterium]